MRRDRRFVSCLCCVVVTLAVANIARAADDYAIKFDRPAKVGDTTRVNTVETDKQSVVTMANGKKVKEDAEESTLRITGEQKVLDVNEKGRTTRISFVVKKCELTKGGQVSELIPSGKTVVVAREAGKPESVYKVDDQELPAQVTARLKDALSVSDPSKPSDDEVMGTKERKKVGDSWDMNTDLMVSTFREMKVPAQKEGTTGTFKLKGVRNVGGVEVMDLEGKAVVPLEPGAHLPQMPEWMSIKTGGMEMTMHGPLTVDPNANSAEPGFRELNMKLTVAGNAPDGTAISVTISRVSTKESSSEVVK